MVAFQELKEYRRAGIRTFADAELYEADKKRKSTVQPSLPRAAPGSLPRNWQYPGSAAAEVRRCFIFVWMTICHIVVLKKQQSRTSDNGITLDPPVLTSFVYAFPVLVFSESGHYT